MDKQPLRVAVVTQESQVAARVAGAGRERGVEVGVVDVGDARFVTRLAAAEAFVLVTPAGEVPVAMRRAIEAGCAEWRTKPVAFVSYGSGSGAVEELRSVFSQLHVVMVGSASDPRTFSGMFEQLEWWGRALRDRTIRSIGGSDE